MNLFGGSAASALGMRSNCADGERNSCASENEVRRTALSFAGEQRSQHRDDCHSFESSSDLRGISTWSGSFDGELPRASNERAHRLVGNSVFTSGGRSPLDAEVSIIREVIETFTERGREELERLAAWLCAAAAFHGSAPPKEDAGPCSVPSCFRLTER